MTTLRIIVKEKSGASISSAPVTIDENVVGHTKPQGLLEVDLDQGEHTLQVTAFGLTEPPQAPRKIVIDDQPQEEVFELDLGLNIVLTSADDFTKPKYFANQGEVIGLSAILERQPKSLKYSVVWKPSTGELVETDQPDKILWQPEQAGRQEMKAIISEEVTEGTAPVIEVVKPVTVLRPSDVQIADPIPVNLRRTQVLPTTDQALWVAIRNRTKAIRFSGSGYEDFINKVLCEGDTSDITGSNALALNRQRNELYNPIHGVGAYELLKTATQVFLLLECGTVIEEFDRYTGEPLYKIDEETSRLGQAMSIGEARERLTDYLGQGRLPYINRVLNTAFKDRDLTDSIFCNGVLAAHANCPPMLELIWSYWHEEGMLAQTMNAISVRFQNRRSKASRDPLAHLEIAPLHPINNLLWGHTQDLHRLSVVRRNYEYNHHYGLKLYGEAVSDFRPADPRSKFLEGFHNLLYLTTLFYKQDDDTTVIADGFPILNALREVHLVLSEGAHNQFGDLPWTARVEMLMEQWILSRPEMREFLQSRAMVPYRESWMPQVDTMKQLQGWTDVSITHFNFLAVYGEQILLSIRYGDWVDVTDPVQAANWAKYWRPEIQNYIHSYRTATGVDLTTPARDSQQAKLWTTQPSELLRQRLKSGRPAPAAPISSNGAGPQSFRQRRAARRAETSR